MACSSSGPGRPATEASPRWPRREAGPILFDPASSARRSRHCPRRRFGCGLNHTSFDEVVGRCIVVQTTLILARSEPCQPRCCFLCELEGLSGRPSVRPAEPASRTRGAPKMLRISAPPRAASGGRLSPILDPVSTDAWRAFVHSRRRRFS